MAQGAANRPVEPIDKSAAHFDNVVSSARRLILNRWGTRIATRSMTTFPITPLRFRNVARTLCKLGVATAFPVEEETPLFAADLNFALTHGGSLTRAFLQSIPLERDANIVVDSSLVWLTPGLVHGFAPVGPLAGPRGYVGFTHEPFPGIASGIRGQSNRNRESIHRICVLGVEPAPEMVEGELTFDSPAEAEEFWFPSESPAFREQEIARRLEDGRLKLTSLPFATIVEFGWGTLLRPRPAEAHGFQFIVRVTSGDRRPHVNGLRNHAQL